MDVQGSGLTPYVMVSKLNVLTFLISSSTAPCNGVSRGSGGGVDWLPPAAPCQNSLGLEIAKK